MFYRLDLQKYRNAKFRMINNDDVRKQSRYGLEVALFWFGQNCVGFYFKKIQTTTVITFKNSIACSRSALFDIISLCQLILEICLEII